WHRLHMGDELAALGAIERGGKRDLDAEFVRPMRLALADALDLGRVQRIDLPPALMLALLAHPLGQPQIGRKKGSEAQARREPCARCRASPGQDRSGWS